MQREALNFESVGHGPWSHSFTPGPNQANCDVSKGPAPFPVIARGKGKSNMFKP